MKTIYKIMIEVYEDVVPLLEELENIQGNNLLIKDYFGFDKELISFWMGKEYDYSVFSFKFGFEGDYPFECSQIVEAVKKAGFGIWQSPGLQGYEYEIIN